MTSTFYSPYEHYPIQIFIKSHTNSMRYLRKKELLVSMEGTKLAQSCTFYSPYNQYPIQISMRNFQKVLKLSLNLPRQK